MSDETAKRGPSKTAGRQEKRAAALRANLKRRKEQARARDAAEADAAPGAVKAEPAKP